MRVAQVATRAAGVTSKTILPPIPDIDEEESGQLAQRMADTDLEWSNPEVGSASPSAKRSVAEKGNAPPWATETWAVMFLSR
jgi:hypothetical protein